MERVGGSWKIVVILEARQEVFDLTCVFFGIVAGGWAWVFCFGIGQFLCEAVFMLWWLGEASKGMSSASMQPSRHVLEHVIGRCGRAFGECHVWMYYLMACGTERTPQKKPRNISDLKFHHSSIIYSIYSFMIIIYTIIIER